MRSVYQARYHPTANPANRRFTHSPIDLSVDLLVWRGLRWQTPRHLQEKAAKKLGITGCQNGEHRGDNESRSALAASVKTHLRPTS